jgi:hypothetical protein
MLSDKEKKRRQHEKELSALRNKMGKNIIWFDALNKAQQYDLLYYWKREKYHNAIKTPQKKTLYKKVSGFVNGRYQVIRKEIELISYPANFKHFLKEMKPRFSVSVTKMREARLQHLLKDDSKS